MFANIGMLNQVAMLAGWAIYLALSRATGPDTEAASYLPVWGCMFCATAAQFVLSWSLPANCADVGAGGGGAGAGGGGGSGPVPNYSQLPTDDEPRAMVVADGGGSKSTAGCYAPLQLEEVDEEEVASLMEPAAEEELTQQPAAGAGGYVPLQVGDDEPEAATAP